MRWHPNTRGFGFQADILCMLLDEGFTCQEVPVSAVHRKGQDSKALTFKNFLSVTHTIVDVVIRFFLLLGLSEKEQIRFSNNLKIV